jgi:acyl carrier protein
MAPMPDDRTRVLLDYVRTKLVVDAGRALTPETRLVSERVIDSMGLVLLAAFVEERFGVRVDDADLRAGEIESVADILALVDRRR